MTERRDGVQVLERAAQMLRALSAEPGGKLSIGPGLISIATAGRRDLRGEAAPYLEPPKSGAAVRDRAGAVAALTVVMPAARPEGDMEHVAAALPRVRDEIQAALSGGGPAPAAVR